MLGQAGPERCSSSRRWPAVVVVVRERGNAEGAVERGGAAVLWGGQSRQGVWPFSLSVEKVKQGTAAYKGEGRE